MRENYDENFFFYEHFEEMLSFQCVRQKWKKWKTIKQMKSIFKSFKSFEVNTFNVDMMVF